MGHDVVAATSRPAFDSRPGGTAQWKSALKTSDPLAVLERFDVLEKGEIGR